MLHVSPVDIAFGKFLELRKVQAFHLRSSDDLTEADTRSKIIDTLFGQVLGWLESDIRREEPAASGYADYLFGLEYPYFHVEAKRLRPRFDLHVPTRARLLKVNGPHLLRNAEMKAHIEQSAKYSLDLGTEIAVLTNGDQVLVLRTRIPGRRWRDQYAIAWHDLDDIQENFAEFYNTLSRDSVRAGAIQSFFNISEGVTRGLFQPISFVHDSDAELVRNRFWPQISKVIGPLLTDQPDNRDLQREIVRNCYVATPLSDEADGAMDSLLRDQPSEFLLAAGTKGVSLAADLRSPFVQGLESDVALLRNNSYILTGGVGSGKTTFLRRYIEVAASELVRKHCVWLHLDYLTIGNAVGESVEGDLRDFTYRHIREVLVSGYPELVPTTGEALRVMLAKEIANARATTLYGVPEEDASYRAGVNEVVARHFGDDALFCSAVLRQAVENKRRVVLIFDNTDQLGERFQEAVFLLAQRMSREFSAISMVALREEKFFSAYRRGIFDAYGDRRFHIGSPNLASVIRKRLEYGRDKLTAQPPLDIASAELDLVLGVVNVLIRSTTERNQNIVRLLSCVSNGDMRHALGMFREFVSSGNTNTTKIVEIVRKEGGYTVPFHEFAKSAILGSRRYYRGSVSHIVNIYGMSTARGASHFTASRILARLCGAESAASAFGRGYVPTVQLLAEYRDSFGGIEDFVQRADELLRRNLLESEPPRSSTVAATQALRTSASGAYYWKYLARAFSYVDLVLIDTGVLDRDLAVQLARLSEQAGDEYARRFERVRSFLDYLDTQERTELEHPVVRGAAYAERLIPQIRLQIENEIKWITSKVKFR